MSKKNHPHKWVNIYPQGTKEGDEEQKFFIALARHPKYVWRSTSALAKESGLSSERVDEIIVKYYNKGMIFQNPKNEDQWGYWERCPSSFYDNKKTSIAKVDQKSRIDSVSSAILGFSYDCGDAHWQGECFVFDKRVALDPGDGR